MNWKSKVDSVSQRAREDVLAEMQSGDRGGFASALAGLYAVADSANREKLRKAFPQLLCSGTFRIHVTAIVSVTDEQCLIENLESEAIREEFAQTLISRGISKIHDIEIDVGE